LLGRFASDARDAIGLMKADEKRRAFLLVLSALLIGLLQIAVVGALYGVLRWSFAPETEISPNFAEVMAYFFGPLDRRQLLALLLALTAIAVAAKVALSYRQTYAMTSFTSDCERRLSADLMFRVLMSPYHWIVRQQIERIRQHVMGFVSIWARDVLGSFMRLANDLFSALMIVVLMIWYDPKAGIAIVLIGGALSAALFLTVRPRLRRLGTQKRDSILEINIVSKQCMDGIKDIKLSSRERDFAAEFEHAMRVYADINTRAQAFIQLPRHVMEACAYLAVVAVGGYAAFGPGPSPELVGLLLLYALATMRLLPVLSTMVSSMSGLTASLPVIKNIYRLKADMTEPPANQGTQVWPEGAWKQIAFDAVSLRYKAGKRAALDGVSLAIETGRRYGAIGQSGAGKSSFLDLLAGLLSPSEGTIRIDGVELTAEHHLAWRRRFGSVTQHPFLIDASLRENIVFQRGVAADPARLARAIALARLEGVVERLAGGVEGRLGERGAMLSGGERQRVAIARAIYSGADILVLDEPTSALDAIVEDEIAESLRSLYGAITTIVVSHRVPLIKDCDEIWWFEEGRLRMRGSHDAMREASELYRRMLDTDAPAISGGAA